MPLTQYAANALANASMGGTAFSAPGNPKIALATSTPTATAAGTEVSGGSYARQTLSSLTAATGSTAGSNAAIISYTSMPAVGGGGITSVDIWDNAGTNRLWYGALTSAKTTNAGDTFSFAIGALTYQIV